jgi:toxin ParE1/3/4
MSYRVIILPEAENDVLDIYKYIMQNDSPLGAEYVFEQIQETWLSLSQLPEKGHTPPELERIGVLFYKEVHFKPYRIIYEIDNSSVYIHCVLDGRRELQQLLENRLWR